MAMTIHCDIVSAEEEIFSGLIEALVATGSEGELGVNYGHAPLLTSLVPGPVRILTQDQEEQAQLWMERGRRRQRLSRGKQQQQAKLREQQ